MTTPYYHTTYQDSQAGLNAPYRDNPTSSGFEMNNQPYTSGDGFKYANGGSQQQFPSSAHVPWYKKKRFLVSLATESLDLKFYFIFCSCFDLMDQSQCCALSLFRTNSKSFYPNSFYNTKLLS